MALRTLLYRTLFRGKKLINVTAVVTRQHYDEHKHYYKNKYGKATAVVFSAAAVGVLAKDKIDKYQNKSNDGGTGGIEVGVKRPDLPTYRADEISKHNTTSSFWVIYKQGVYDITSFLPSHPGGNQILNAGGYSIEPFWNVYGMHKTEDIYKLLESYRIGNLHDDDIVDHSDDELWAQEPHRDKRLIVKTARPFNAETPPTELVEHFDTPNELFYVRQHMPVPDIDPSTHKLKVYIKGKVDKEFEFSLKDLEKFKQVEMRAALMCAGNRRSEMNEVRPVKGLDWTTGAISNALWGGVLLRDVLRHCGLDLDDTDGKHVIMRGADVDATGVQFSTSVPLQQALGALLATRMNAAPLPPDHGRPLRALLPGAPAVRSVKWLESITVSTEESDSHWHRRDYRSFNASVTWETADWDRAPPVYSVPVTAALCRPAPGTTAVARDGAVLLEGYAYSGGGAKIVRVDVSVDGGRSWAEAALRRDAAPAQQHYAWALWRASVPVRKDQTQLEIWVKATDSNFNTQPEKFDDIWNIRGILGNAYHKVKLQIKHE